MLSELSNHICLVGQPILILQTFVMARHPLDSVQSILHLNLCNWQCEWLILSPKIVS
jgi:hypothetical protein